MTLQILNNRILENRKDKEQETNNGIFIISCNNKKD